MMRAAAAGAFVVCLGVAAACGGDRRDDQGNNAAADDRKTAEGRPAPVTQTGCVTARGDQFVLTDLDRGTSRNPDQAATETYQLIGHEDELRQHVGKQVRVSGEAEPAQVAEIRETTPPAPPASATGTSGQSPAGTQPQVTAQTETRLEVAKLRVQSVTPTGESCTAETRRQ